MRFLLLLTLVSCASHPPFRKGDDGYTVRETPIPEILEIHAAFPPSTPEAYRADYLARAAGEECAARKFPFFDYGTTKNGVRAFCYSKDERMSLGATFAMKAAASSPAELRVEDTKMGKHSPFRPWDVIRKVGGREVHDLTELKESVFLAGRKGLRQVSVLVERSEIPLMLESPISTDSGLPGTPDALEVLRTKAP